MYAIIHLTLTLTLNWKIVESFYDFLFQNAWLGIDNPIDRSS